jgi:hypothetical protein
MLAGSALGKHQTVQGRPLTDYVQLFMHLSYSKTYST